MVPYQLGTGPTALAIKVSAKSQPITEQDAAPDKMDPDFLRHAMVRTRREREAIFTFEIQPRTSTELSVEDVRIEWREETARFYPVASIVIPRQDFHTKPRNSGCELLSYPPWQGLPDHEPLGAVSRMRKVIYEAVRAFRREKAKSVSRGSIR